MNSDRYCNNDNSISNSTRVLSRFSPEGIFSKCIFLRFEYDLQRNSPGWPSREFRIRRFVNLFSVTPGKLLRYSPCMHAYARIERASPVAFRVDFVLSPRETSLYATPYIFFPTISSQYTLLLSARIFQPRDSSFPSRSCRNLSCAFGKDPRVRETVTLNSAA